MNYHIIEECKDGEIAYFPWVKWYTGSSFGFKDGSVVPVMDGTWYSSMEEAQQVIDIYHKERHERELMNWTKYHTYEP